MNKLLGMNIKKEMLWITVCIPMIIMFPCINKKGKKTFILANIIYLIFSILIYANYVYYNYSTNFLSVFQIENIKYAEDIKEKTDYDQLNKIYEENKNSKKVNEELTGIAKGKNIMKTSGRIYILH